MTNQNKELSVCCNAEKRATVSDEGTGYYQCANCGNEFIPRKPVDVERAKALIRHGKELETWEEQLNKIWSRGHVPEWANDVKTVTTSLIREVESQALERGKEGIIKNIGMLRQWLNEDRITDPNKMVTDEQLKFWLNI